MNMVHCIVSMLSVMVFTFATFAQTHDYTEALHKTTYFYGANRCGDTKSWCHGACHTRDGERDGIDLSGGWHDCGDHVKFGQTNCITAVSLLLGYNYFPTAYEDRYSQDFSEPPPNGIPDILDEVKIFTDYLMKACTGGKVYYQVGDRRDHAHVSEPVYASSLDVSKGGEPRYAYSKTSGASNFCGSAAAALALMSMCYAKFSQSYADSCIAKAKEYYTIGDANHESVPDYDQEFYNPGGEWEDDMAMGAIELYRATQESNYLNDAKDIYDGNYMCPTGWVLCWGNISPLVAYELYNVTNDDGYKSDLRREVEANEARMDWCGYPHFSGWGSLQYASGAGLVGLYYNAISDDNDAYTYGKGIIDFCLGTHDNLGGDAPKNYSFVTDYNELNGGSPQYPHHRAAFGKGNNAGTLWSEEASDPGSIPYEHKLVGALVGGPQTECAEYEDNINNYYTNEVCIYYNAYIVPSLGCIKVKEGLTSTKHKILSINSSIKYVVPVSMLSSELYSIAPSTPPDAVICVYDFSGRKLDAFIVGNQRTVDLKRKLKLSDGVVIVKIKK